MAQIPEAPTVKTQILESDLAPSRREGEADLYTKDASLSLVVSDANQAEAWMNGKQLSLWWREIDVLYQSPRKSAVFEGTQVTRSNVSRYKVAQHVWSILPQLVRGLFYMDPPFMLRPRPGTSQDTVRAKTAVFSSILAEIGFRMEVMRGLFFMLLFGTGVWKYGWTSESRKKKKYVRKLQEQTVDIPLQGPTAIPAEQTDEFEVKEYEDKIERPFFEHVDIRHILVDPGCPVGDIRKAKYVIHKMYLTFDKLDQLRNVRGYNLPSRSTLRSYFFPEDAETAVAPGPGETAMQGIAPIHHAERRDTETTLDPEQHTLEVLERWDDDKVITVLNRKLVIRNEANPLGQKPFLSSSFWEIPNAFWGIGIGHIVGQEQRVEQGTINGALDMLAIALNPQFLRNRGANVPTQMIRQRLGGIIDVDGDVDKAFRLLETPKIPGEVWTVIQQAQAAGEAASGANELLVQGSMPTAGRTSMGRTATGASGMQNASATRLDGPLSMFVDQVFTPWIQILDQLVNENMPIRTLRQIVGQDIKDEDFSFDPESYLNADLKYEILAGAHLSAKRAMSQSLPLIIQVLENQTLLQQLQQTGKTIDVGEIFNMLFEVSEWRNEKDVVRDLNDQEKQALQQSNPAAQQLQGKMMLNQQQAGIKAAQQDSDTMGRAAREVLRQVTEKMATPIETEGQSSDHFQG